MPISSVFLIGTSTGAPYIQFQVTCNTNAMQTIDLVPNYTVNGIVDLYGVFTASSYVQPAYNIYYGVDQLLHTHTGSYSSAVYTEWIHVMTGSVVITVNLSNQSEFFPQQITEILTQDIVTSISGSQTQIPMSYNLGNGGIIINMLQVNPTGRSASTYNNGIRIGNYNSESSLYLGCATTAINTTQSGQWKISKTSDNALTINPSSLRQADHSAGLSINSDSSVIKFNRNGLVDVGSSTSFAGVTSGNIQIYPTATSYDDGLRISRSDPDTGNATIQLGCSRTSNTGAIVGQWSIFTPPSSSEINPQGFAIAISSQSGDNNRGLQISTDGNTLTFNGRVL
ncbi:MAG: hypothetical protein EZS28_002469 [Streblomastix strix]|uniref:Uncharacterized protein n=1 Tax=Streblomastix strix TaxID=222440 RepID=A0A5J4X637_9EUKA|nr:MAG: hypothetical protein EZS28_002469 [Streblomastix strix]